MTKYNVYAISDWPENLGERIVVYWNKPFESKDAALKAAATQYDLEFEIEVVK